MSCKNKCPLKASRHNDDYTLGYCDGLEQGRTDERNEILKELGNQLTQANCEKGIECVMARIRYVLGDEQSND